MVLLIKNLQNIVCAQTHTCICVCSRGYCSTVIALHLHFFSVWIEIQCFFLRFIWLNSSSKNLILSFSWSENFFSRHNHSFIYSIFSFLWLLWSFFQTHQILCIVFFINYFTGDNVSIWICSWWLDIFIFCSNLPVVNYKLKQFTLLVSTGHCSITWFKYPTYAKFAKENNLNLFCAIHNHLKQFFPTFWNFINEIPICSVSFFTVCFIIFWKGLQHFAKSRDVSSFPIHCVDILIADLVIQMLTRI